jgi:hypothetical protein
MRGKTDFDAAVQIAFEIAKHSNPFLASDEFISCATTSRISLVEAYAADAEDNEDHPVGQT